MLLRRRLIIILYLISMFTLNTSVAQSLMKLDLKNGFKDFKLGQRKMQFLLLDLNEVFWKAEGMDTIKPEIEIHIKRYEVIVEKEEDKYIGPYLYNSVSLYFYKEKLYEIVVTIKTELSFLGIYETLRAKYGSPTSGKKTKEAYNDQILYSVKGNEIVWDGTRVRLQLSYDNTRYDHDNSYTIVSKSNETPEKSDVNAAVLSFKSKSMAKKMRIYENKKRTKATRDL